VAKEKGKAPSGASFKEQEITGDNGKAQKGINRPSMGERIVECRRGNRELEPEKQRQRKEKEIQPALDRGCKKKHRTFRLCQCATCLSGMEKMRDRQTLSRGSVNQALAGGDFERGGRRLSTLSRRCSKQKTKVRVR